MPNNNPAGHNQYTRKGGSNQRDERETVQRSLDSRRMDDHRRRDPVQTDDDTDQSNMLRHSDARRGSNH